MPLSLNDTRTNCNILISRRFHLCCYFAIFQGQKVNFKVKHDFSANNARITCDASFECDFVNETSIHRLILKNWRSSSMLKGQPQGQPHG